MSLGLAVSLLDGPAAAGEGALAWLRGLTGADELALDEAASESPAARATRLLATATDRIAALPPPPPDPPRGLPLGARGPLFLGCPLATSGPETDLVARSPPGACRNPPDLSVPLADLLEPPPLSDRP